MRAFLFYIDDWLSSNSVSMMDAEEERGYLRLLLAAAGEHDCGLPDDDNWLANTSLLGSQWFRPTRTKIKRIGGKTSGQKLRAKFILRHGRLFNERLLREWEHQQDVLEKRREAGLKGGRPRKHLDSSEEPNGLANGNQMAKQTKTNDVSVLDFDLTTQTKENSEENKTLNDLLAEWFKEFWMHAWRKTGKKEARKSYEKKVRNQIMRELVSKSVIRDRPMYLAREVEHRPHMATWLNQERYNDEPESVDFKSSSKAPVAATRDRVWGDACAIQQDPETVSLLEWAESNGYPVNDGTQLAAAEAARRERQEKNETR